MNTCYRDNRAGFSLVELSIVLVILGLLTGGILTGQSLIRASELRSAAADLSRFKAASHTFRDKYFAIPGDMVNASAFWGLNPGCPGTAGTGTQACNGDGDGMIEQRSAVTGSTSDELFQVWVHLANAGLVEGSYTGVSGPLDAALFRHAIPGTNVPRSKVANAGYTMRWLGPRTAADAFFFPGDYGNVIEFGIETTQVTSGIFLKPEDAWNIDTKLDDGMPASGIVMMRESHTTCHGSTDPALATYQLTDTANRCSPIFLRVI